MIGTCDADSCDVVKTQCVQTITVLPELSPPAPDVIVQKNRYLSFTEMNASRQVAVRVTFVDLPSPYHVFNGVSMWVGTPRAVSELGGKNDSTPPTFNWATLGCSPTFLDWGAVGTVHVSHEAIVPAGIYDIQVVDFDLATNLSAPLTITQAAWGDIGGFFSDGSWPGPDGNVDVTSDTIAAIDKFENLPSAPTKARVDLEPRVPDQLINITDIVQSLTAFEGFTYPFAPEPVPCSSLSESRTNEGAIEE